MTHLETYYQTALPNIPDDVLIAELRKRGYALSIWCVDDVKYLAHDMEVELTEDEAKDILCSVDEGLDAEYGINWTMIRCNIEDYIRDREV